jgi:hypothetical protein
LTLCEVLVFFADDFSDSLDFVLTKFFIYLAKKNMKKLVYVLLIAISATSYAQKCKYDYEKKDAFTGKTSVAIFCDLTKFWSISVAGASDNSYSLNLGLLFSGAKKDVIRKGDTLMIALENAPPIILIAAGEFLPSLTTSGSSIYTKYNPSYSITKEQLLMLSQHNMPAFRVYFGSLWSGDDVKPKNAQKISKAAECIVGKTY